MQCLFSDKTLMNIAFFLVMNIPLEFLLLSYMNINFLFAGSKSTSVYGHLRVAAKKLADM